MLALLAPLAMLAALAGAAKAGSKLAAAPTPAQQRALATAVRGLYGRGKRAGSQPPLVGWLAPRAGSQPRTLSEMRVTFNGMTVAYVSQLPSGLLVAKQKRLPTTRGTAGQLAPVLVGWHKTLLAASTRSSTQPLQRGRSTTGRAGTGKRGNGPAKPSAGVRRAVVAAAKAAAKPPRKPRTRSK